MTSSDTSKPKVTIQLVYIGMRVGKGGKAFQTFKKIEADGTLEDGDRWYSKVKHTGRPGGVFKVECDAADESTIYSGTLTYQHMWDDEEQVATWQAQHDAYNAADRARKRFKKDTGANRVLECLEPIREAYHNATGLERQVILAQAVSYITRWNK